MKFTDRSFIKCTWCGRRHWNEKGVSLPMCPKCFSDYIEEKDMAEPKYEKLAQCNLPPKGWECRLEAGHDGSCPTYREPWNDFRPDLTRVGVEAAARRLYEVDFNEYGGATPDFEEYKQEWEEDAVSILRAYQKANQGEPNGI